MAAHLEVWREEGVEHVALSGDRVTVGRDPQNDVSVPDDPTVSRRHAVLERLAAGWAIADLGSLNGTAVNGEPVTTGARPLYSGDEIELGDTRMVYRSA